ncbi:uncharacterized protein LOC143431793 [Xylocopa sonorina]|uniref:uncharacterized protein LOC143431793 n=1 Tax=Xylocopa sonorina TaxID=1818115 RepID=UPI00403ABDE4
MAMYKDPVWSGDLMVSSRSMQLLRNVWRRLNIRVIRGQLRGCQNDSDPSELLRKALRFQVRRSVLNTWRELLNSRHGSHRTVGAALTVLSRWVDRSHGRLTFRTTQVLTGHGCFGENLHRISREVTGICHHCDGLGDTAQHTPERCPACPNVAS